MGSRGKKRGNVRDEVIDFAGESKLLCGEANEEFFNFIRGRRVRHWRATRAPMIRDAGGILVSRTRASKRDKGKGNN